MSIMLPLPDANGKLAPYTLSDATSFPDKVTRPLNRVALAAAHVVADPKADVDPWLKAAPDWERTLAYRHYLWDLGLGVAEAMDTAQRGMGLDWTMALELIRQSVAVGARPQGRRHLLRRRHRSPRPRCGADPSTT